MGRCNSNITLGAMKQRETQRSVLSKSQKPQDSHMTRVAVYIIETVFAIIIRSFQKLKLRMLLPKLPNFSRHPDYGKRVVQLLYQFTCFIFPTNGKSSRPAGAKKFWKCSQTVRKLQWACDQHPTPLCCVLVSSGSSHFLNSVFGVRLQVKMGMISVGTCHKRQRKGNKISQA